MKVRSTATLVCLSLSCLWAASDSVSATFPQQIRTFHTSRNGLPSDDVLSVAAEPDGTLYAATAAGLGQNNSFEDCCAARVRNHCRSLPTN